MPISLFYKEASRNCHSSGINYEMSRIHDGAALAVKGPGLSRAASPRKFLGPILPCMPLPTHIAGVGQRPFDADQRPNSVPSCTVSSNHLAFFALAMAKTKVYARVCTEDVHNLRLNAATSRWGGTSCRNPSLPARITVRRILWVSSIQVDCQADLMFDSRSLASSVAILGN